MPGYRYEKVLTRTGGEDEEGDGEEVEDSRGGSEESQRPFHANARRPYRHGVLLILQVIFLLTNIALLAWNLSPTATGHPIQPFSPARSSVQYGVERIDAYEMHSSPFVGEPRLELDEAWSDLLRSTNIRISEDEMRKMNKTSVALTDGEGYLGYLEVHHMLHCLFDEVLQKRFKQFRHLEHYPELNKKTFDLPHWDHCIEVIRRGIMCNADLMIDTLEWNEDGTWLQGVNRWPRVCANWDSVQAFADSRAVPVDHFNPLDGFWPSDDERSIGPTDL